MKKVLLLGAILVLGTVANGASASGNTILENLDATGNGTAVLEVEVRGKVVSDTGLTLAVQIDSEASTNGKGMVLQMPDMFVNATASQTGTFTTALLKNKAEVAMLTGTLSTEIKAVGATGTPNAVTGAVVDANSVANDVTMDYSLTTAGVVNLSQQTHTLTAIAKSKGTVGTFTHTSTKVIIKLAGATA
jgi:hypothetical protein